MPNLKDLLENARFFGAKSETIDSVDILRSAPAAGHSLQLVRARHGDDTSLYQVLVDAAGNDVLGDNATALGEALAGGAPAGFGELHGSAAKLTGLSGQAIDGEQTNTTLVFGDQLVVKYFRQLQPGVNPDVEMLRDLGDCPHVAPVRGWVSTELDGEELTLAMLQDFIPDAVDGWEYALGFARLGAPFSPETNLIGAATRSVHEALAWAFPTTELAAETLVERLEDQLSGLVARAEVLRPFQDQAREFYRHLLDGGSTLVPVQRLHGDLHLGQLLRSPEDYVLIDFEGEPARPIAQRRQLDSPLRDVAGLLRSLDYAAHTASAETGWVRSASRGLLAGYGVEQSPLLSAYVLDKALYEVVYETTHRPDWVDIPLAAVSRLLD